MEPNTHLHHNFFPFLPLFPKQFIILIKLVNVFQSVVVAVGLAEESQQAVEPEVRKGENENI
jgi:hypothetical protein